VPVAQPPHKEVPDEPGAEERLRMCELAVAGDARLGVSRMEIDRGGPSFTVDTLRALRARTPEDELTFIIGGDMALSLPTWREPQSVLDLATLAVAERSGGGRRDILERLEQLGGSEPRVRFFEMPRIDVSSSLVRRRVAEGRSVRYLVPDAVAQRIAERGLYLTATGRSTA
jgi:nicotinate-nucleotide adenylyltransferase